MNFWGVGAMMSSSTETHRLADVGDRVTLTRKSEFLSLSMLWLDIHPAPLGSSISPRTLHENFYTRLDGRTTADFLETPEEQQW